MILPHTAIDEACRVGERIRSQVAELTTGNVALSVSISVGIASFPEAARDADGIIGAADAALLTAKASGRNRLCTWSETGAGFVTYTFDTPLASLGRRFGQKLGLTDEEATALAAALHVVESGKKVGPELYAVGDETVDQSGNGRSPTVSRLFEALLYGTERWDGRGYPEGLIGESIPRVARAYALVQAYGRAGDGAIAAVRTRSGKQLDPRMVNRFLAFLAEEAKHFSPLTERQASGGGRARS